MSQKSVESVAIPIHRRTATATRKLVNDELHVIIDLKYQRKTHRRWLVLEGKPTRNRKCSSRELVR